MRNGNQPGNLIERVKRPLCASHGVERLPFLLAVGPKHLARLLKTVGEDGFYQMAGNTFGSHILEKGLAQALANVQAKGGVGGVAAPLREVLGGVTDHMASSILDYMTDRCASHVFRQLVSLLAGRDISSAGGGSQKRDQKGETSGRQETARAAKGKDVLSTGHWKVSLRAVAPPTIDKALRTTSDPGGCRWALPATRRMRGPSLLPS